MLKRAYFLSLLCCLALPGGADTTRPLLPLPTLPEIQKLAPAADPDHFAFVLAGDNRAAGRDLPIPPTAGRIFEEMRLLQPAFALWTGDSIYGSDDSVGEADAEYRVFLTVAAQSNTPIYNAPGNHEIFDRPELAALYEQRMGRLYGSFDYGHSHCIALNTEEIGLNGGIGKAQRDWLERDLEANKGAAHIFAFTHHPLFAREKEGFSNIANRDDIHKLFVKYGVKNVFSGHDHVFFKSVHDGITYWVTGGAGAPSDASPEEGGFQHYLFFTVDGPNVSAIVLQPWRLFAQVSPVAADGSCSVQAANYNYNDLPVCAELPTSLKPEEVLAEASWTYKGKTHPLEVTLVPSRSPGVITLRALVPKARAATFTIRPKKIAK